MKTYVLTIAKRFPVKFGKTIWGTTRPTWFAEKIKRKQKIHTIRANYQLWKKRIDQVNAGLAVISIRQWTDVPYRSKQKEIMVLKKAGIQKLDLLHKKGLLLLGVVDGFNHNICTLAANDGLDIQEFSTWFADYDKRNLAIIHFTKFRYNA